MAEEEQGIVVEVDIGNAQVEAGDGANYGNPSPELRTWIPGR